jgi:hypothetical protein
MSASTPLKIVHRRVTKVKPGAPKRNGSKPFPTDATSLEDLIKKVNSTDYATMPKAARKAMLADLEAHYLKMEKRMPFDPSGLPELARAKWPSHPWLADALRACTVQWAKDELYSYFIDPATRATQWKFQCTLMLDCPRRGGLAIDILQGHRIGGIEFLDAVMGRPTSAEGLEREIRALAAIRPNK